MVELFSEYSFREDPGMTSRIQFKEVINYIERMNERLRMLEKSHQKLLVRIYGDMDFVPANELH